MSDETSWPSPNCSYRYAELIDAGATSTRSAQLLARADVRTDTGPQPASVGVGRRRPIAEAVRDDHPPLPRPREHARAPAIWCSIPIVEISA